VTYQDWLAQVQVLLVQVQVQVLLV